MSYRVDIPTLSANEVYTLTFEYEGTETIQLIVGDLTLETTDRRVVFTTTSPVNYIESNMNLTNLNIYEGYYESDDFGGEYTQESYIEGKSLINYKRRVDYGTLINNANIQETFTDDNYINYKQLGTGATGRGFHGGNKFAKGLDQSKDYTIVLRIRKNTFPKDVFIPFTLSHRGEGVKFDEAVKGSYWGISYDISGGQTGVWKAVVKAEEYNMSLADRYWGNIYSLYIDENSEVTDLTQRTDIVGCEVEYAVEVLQGNYFDIDTDIDEHFEGIGCVKSPRVISREQPLNMFYCTNWTSTLNNGTVTCQDGKFYFDGSFGGYTWFDIINGGEVKNNIYLEPGSYHAKMKVHSKEPCAATGTCVSIEATMENGITLDLCSVYTSKDKMYNQVTAAYKNFTSPIVKLTLKIWYGGNGNNNIIIDGIYIGKTNIGDDLSFKETNVITTPDDLELYKVNDTIYDKLDLTTGTLYKNTGTYVLDETFVDRTSNWTTSVDNTTGNVIFTSRQHKYLREEHNFPGGLYNNAIVSNADPANNIVNNSNIVITRPRLYFDIYSNNNYTVIIMPASYNVKTLEELRTWLQNNPMIFNYKLGTPYTEQLDINPLKSYHNGSIQTSSQQLVPTLKTTLPISNKFTTTNLTSGSTYNVYFDGTATKLDAGGTIITNPVSPCEVECGGTTLTIEGTDIQNVRVIETTVKNEVGSVNATTDVELKKMKTCKYENILDDIKYSTTVWNGAVINISYDDFCIEFMGAHEWAGEFADTGLKYPTGCNLVHVEFDIDMDKPNSRMAINFNEGIYNYYPQHRHVTLNNDTATIAQGNYDNVYTSIITKGHFSRLMYANGDRPIIINLYTGHNITGILATGNSAEGSINGYETMGYNYGRITNLRMRIIENFSTNYTTVTSMLRDSSYNIIWQDMDMTMPATTSKLEQPIKLRSLGTTYDSYNPVTGELTKRIGVSETDGSYSVLSSPIVSKICNQETITNLLLMDELVLNGTTYGIPVANKPTKITLIALNKTVDKCPRVSLYNSSTNAWVNNVNLQFDGDRVYYTAPTGQYIGSIAFYCNGASDIYAYSSIDQFLEQKIVCIGGIYENQVFEYFEGTMENKINIRIPHLYTNGQVKVYSDSEVYPTTILNGQSTNNYEINELNTSNNYTIRYDGECESINLANKSNEQGTNKIVKTSTNGSGNLTFVNDSGDINNVLLVQNDVREQEINHFNGLQTVEVSGMLVQNQRNMFCYKDISAPYGGYVISVTPIPVQPSETLYCVVYNAVRYSCLIEYDSDMNQLQRTEINVGYGDNGNAVKLTENTYYVKVETGASYERNVMISRGGFLPLELGENIYQGAYIDLPQPVQLNSLPDGTCDTYNPITGEYVQNVGTIQWDSSIVNWNKTWSLTSSPGYTKLSHVEDWGSPNYETLVNEHSMPNTLTTQNSVSNNATMSREFNGGWSYFGAVEFGAGKLAIIIPKEFSGGIDEALQYLDENPIIINYKRTTPITTQLTPIEIPTFEGGILQLITTDGKVFPMIEYSMPTNNRYDTSSWEAGAVYTQRNMTEAYFNESTTPMIPTETMTLTTDHISSGSIILNDNGNGLIVLKGNYTGRDIPYFTGMRSVEAIEVETTPSPDQPLFGKGGRK